MGLWNGRRRWIRLAIYLAVLVVVWLLWRQRSGLLPSYGLAVSQVKEVSRLGSLAATEGERLLAVDVRVSLPEDFSRPLEPYLFRLLDDRGEEHVPDPGSPLFALHRMSQQDRSREGTLVFHLPLGTSGQSLVLHPEVYDQDPGRRPEPLEPREEK